MQIPYDIILGCQQQARKAQNTLHKLAYTKLMQISLRYVGNNDEAQEIVNTAFLKIFTKIDLYHYEENFEAWIKTITIRCALDYLKSSNRQKEASLDETTYNLTNTSNDTLQTKDLLNILNTLPSMPRAVFNMFAIDGYSHAEIAATLNISESNSKYILHNARKQLQEKVNKYYYA